MLVSIRHTTRYTYDLPAFYGVVSLRLSPRPYKGLRLIHWDVRVAGAGDLLTSRDGFGNIVQLAVLNAPHDGLEIEAVGTVDLTDTHGVVSGLVESAPSRVYLRETPQTDPDDAIRALAREIPQGDTLTSLHDLSALVRARIEYEIGATHARTSASQALAAGRGVCQDHAHVFIAAARHLGIPARYVTGYLVPDGVTSAEIELADLESDAHHAWAEAWVPGLGWVGFDVANRVCPTDRYVRLACGLDAGYAAPIRGSRRGGAGEKLDVRVQVEAHAVQQ